MQIYSPTDYKSIMSVSVLVVAILLSVSNNAISQCPPDSGKSLNLNRLLMIGIYLMYNGDCYPNDSYFRNIAIKVCACDDLHFHSKCHWTTTALNENSLK